ncbi:MAG: ATP phosphoribosyltransferase [Candidatus Methylacidiphilales bacterium]
MSRSNPKQLRIGLPSGSLQDSTLSLFRSAGFHITVSSRSYKPSIDDPEYEVRLLRAQEIAKYVEDGFLDLGITGKDWVQETRSKVHVVRDLPFNKATKQPARWVLVVPENSKIKTPKDLQGKRIATEAVNLTADYLKKHGIKAHVEFSWGATEVKVPELVDAIVDITETGSSLRANQLRIVDTLVESYPQLIVNHSIWKTPPARKKIETLSLLLEGALNAREKVGLKMNVASAKLPQLLKALPALRNPTISHLSNGDWVAIEIVIDEVVVREIIPQLKELGAEGIIEFPLNKVVY